MYVNKSVSSLTLKIINLISQKKREQKCTSMRECKKKRQMYSRV